jgi:hypothetical protein
MTKLKLQKKSKAKNWMLEHNLSFYFISSALYTPILICICIWKVTHAINEYILTTKAKLLVSQSCSLVLHNAKKRRHHSCFTFPRTCIVAIFANLKYFGNMKKHFWLLKSELKAITSTSLTMTSNALDFMANLYMDCWMSKEVVVIAGLWHLFIIVSQFLKVVECFFKHI